MTLTANLYASETVNPVQGLSHYMASKMGVIGFMRGLANDVASDGITANAILPALTNTRATRDLPAEFKQSIWQQQAIKRFAEPSDITRSTTAS